MSTTAAENSLNSRRLFLTPPPKWETLPRAVMPRSDTRRKVPSANSPYGIAKQVQLLEKDPSRAVSLFWAAINSGDRVDSALKDMAVVMKQLNRSDEAIEAIKSFRHLCPAESQESLDNVLLELYKRSGKLQEEIQMLQIKLKHIEEGISFSGKRTKVGRCQGRKVHITIEKEYSRLLGNLAWAYLQQNDYRSAEEYYRKALSLEQDKNKQCNLAICLIHLDKMTEAKFLLQTVRTSSGAGQIDESFSRSYARATQILREFESDHSLKPINQKEAMYGETHKSFSSCTRGNLRGPSQTANANKLPGCQTLKRPSEIHQDELHGASSLLQNFHASDIGFSGSKSRNMKGTFCGSRRLHNGKTEQDCLCMKDYDASLSQTKSPRVLFTQPHKCLRLSNKGNNRRGWYAEESNGGCSRKLLFQQEKESENLHLLPCYNINQEPESHRGSTSEDRRENMLGDPAKMTGESSVMSISFGVWKGDFSETDEQGKDAKDEFNLGLKTSSGGYSTRNFAEDSGGNSTSTVNSAKLIQEAENGNQIQKSKHQLKTNIEHLPDFPTREKSKSWADMVEEDDQELLNERRDSPVHDQEFPSKKSVLPPKYTPKKDSDDGEAGEEFADENGNSNIILDTTPCSLNQCESLSQNIESLVLRDGGYYTQPKYASSSTNQRARQRFSYDQYGKRE